MSRYDALKSHQSRYKTVATGDDTDKGDNSDSSVDRRSSRSRKRYSAVTSEVQEDFQRSIERKSLNIAHIPRVTYNENEAPKQPELSYSTKINARTEISEGNSFVYRNLDTALREVNVSNIDTALRAVNISNINAPVVWLRDISKTKSVIMKKGSAVDIGQSAEMGSSSKPTKNPTESKAAGLKTSGTKSPKTRSPTRKSKLVTLNKSDKSLEGEVECSLDNPSNSNALGIEESALVHEMSVKNDSETKGQASNVPKIKCKNSDPRLQKNSPKKKGKKGSETKEETKDTKGCESSMETIPEITVTPPKDNEKPFQHSPSQRRIKKADNVTGSTKVSGKVKARTTSNSPNLTRKRLSPSKSNSVKDRKAGESLSSRKEGKCSESSSRKGKSSESPSPTRKGKRSESRSPTRKGKFAESPSPTRKRKSAESPSPTRKRKSAESPSPKRKESCSESLSPTRKGKSSISPSSSQKEKSPSKSPQLNSSNLEVPNSSGDSGRPSKRVRSPNAKFKEDIILYPWENIRKSPKKSQIEKSTESNTQVKKEDLSDTDRSSTTEYSEPSPAETAKKPNNSSNDLVDENIVKQEEKEVFEPKPGCSKTLDMSHAQVLDFDCIPKIETPDRLLTKAIDYKYTGGTEKPRVLSDLIAKLNNSIVCTDKKLIDLFGEVEEPDYVDEEVSCIPDENNGESNDSIDSDKTIVDFASTSSPKSEDNDEIVKNAELNVDLNGDDDKPKENIIKDIKSGNATESTDSVCGTSSDVGISEDVVPRSSQKEDETSESSSCDKTVAANTSGDLNSVINDKENPEELKDFPDETTTEETTCNDTNTSSIDMENIEDCVGNSPKSIFDLFGLSLKRKTKPDLKSSADKEQVAQKNGMSVETDLKDANRSGNSVSLLTQTCEMQMDSGNKHDVDKVGDKESMQNESENRNKDNSEVIELLDDQIDKNISISDDDDCMVVSATEPKKEVVVLSDDDCQKEVDGDASSPRKKHKVATIDHSVEPAPLDILSRMEKSVTDKKSAFISEELEKYIETNKESDGPGSNDTDKDMDTSDFKKPEPPSDIKSQLKNVDPDFDEIGGHIFLSFQHENALKAHLQLEEKIDWLNDTNIKKIAQMKLLKERQGDSGSKRVTDVKSRDEQKQSFRGIPMRTLKYQKLLKRELEVILQISDQTTPENLLPKSPEKTSDITKIKGWKKKFQNTEELQEATGLHFSETGKLHWKTESRLLKNLDPDDVKDIGLDLKKKRRKLVNYSNKRKPGNKSEKQEDDFEYEFDYESAITEKDVYDEDEDKPLPDKLPYHIKYHSQHKYGARKMFVKKMGLDSKDEMILKKLGTIKLITARDKQEGGEGVTPRRKEKPSTLILSKVTQSMALAAVSALDKKLMNKAKSLSKVEERKKKLAEQALKAKEVKLKEETRDEDERDGWDTSMEAEDGGMPSASGGEDEGLADGTGGGTVPEAPLTRSRRSSLRDSTGTHDADRSQKKMENQESCNKPGASQSLKGCKRGCRYGCICHLCKFSDSGEEKEAEVKPPCDKEYCRLGCICESIDTSAGSHSHCRKPSCMFECKCPPKQPKPDIPKERDRRGKKKRRRGRGSSKKHSAEIQTLEDEEGDQPVTEAVEQQVGEGGKGEDAEDWEPPSKRRRGPANPRYANLPRRESTYRLAKNLDAVSRKALSVYESSEMYVEQKMRRRKSEHTAESMIEDDGLMEAGDLSHARQALRKSCVQVETTREMADMSGPRLNPETGVMEISDDDSDLDQTFSNVQSAARIRGYYTRWKPPKSGRKKRSQEFTYEDEGGKNSKSSTSDVIDLVDSDEDNSSSTQARASRSNLPSTSGGTGGGSSNKTVSQKLGLAKNKLMDSDSNWKTQMVCLKAKKKSDDSSQDGKSEIKLLEIISNTQWENDRTNMLSKISHVISKDYRPNHVVMWGRYVLHFLPRADKPAVIPPELQSKLPNAMYSIRVRVTRCSDDEAQPQTERKEIVDKTVDVGEEISKSFDEEKRKLGLKQQKKLIEKIKFAERLRDLIKTEQMKGIEVSKYNVSLDGIEKALKRYKTQLWKAYTGSSNLTIDQLKKAVEAARKGSKHSAHSLEERVSLAVKKVNERQKAANATSTVTTNTVTLASSTLSRIQANQGLQVVRNTTSTQVNPKLSSGFIPLSDLQTSKQVKQLIPLTAAANAAISTNLVTPSVITTTPNAAPVAQSVLVNSTSNVINSETGSNILRSAASGSPSEVLLIPVGDSGQTKTGQVLSAKVAMIPSEGNNGGSAIMKSIPVSLKGQPNGPVRMQLVSRGNTKLSKPVLNPVLSAYASAPLLKTQSSGVIRPQSQIMLNSIKPVSAGSPVLGQVRLVSQQMNVVGQPAGITGQPISVVRSPVVGQPAGITGQPISVVRSPVSVVGQQMNIVGQAVRFTAVSTAQQFVGAGNFSKTCNAPVGVAKPLINGSTFRPPVTKATSLLANNSQLSMYPIRYAYSSGTDPSKCQVRQIIQNGTDSSSLTLIPAVINSNGKLTTESVSLGVTNTSNSVTAMQKVLTHPTAAASSGTGSLTQSQLITIPISNAQNVQSISSHSPVAPLSGTPVSTVSSQSPQIMITPKSFSGQFRTFQKSSGQFFQAVPISIGIGAMQSSAGVVLSQSSAGIVTSADVSLNGLCTSAPSVPPVVMTQRVSPSRLISVPLKKDVSNSESVSTNSEEKIESDKSTNLSEVGNLAEQIVSEISDDSKVSVSRETISTVDDNINMDEHLGQKVDDDKDCVKSLDDDYSETYDLTGCDSDGNGDLDSLGSSLRSFSSLGESGSIKSMESVDAKSWDIDSKERDVSEKFITEDSCNAEVNELLSVARRAGIEIANTLEPLDTPVKKNETCPQENSQEAISMDETIAENSLKKNESVRNGEHAGESVEHEDVNELLSAARKAGLDIANTLSPIDNPLKRASSSEVHVNDDVTKEVYSVEDGEDSDSCLLIDECFNAVKKRKIGDMMSSHEGNPRKKKVYTVQRPQSSSKGRSFVQIEDSEESDVDIMSVDPDCESLQRSATSGEVLQPSAQVSRRKSELKSREAMEDMKVVIKGKIDHSNKRNVVRTHLEKGRRRQIRSLFEHLSKILVQYNPKLHEQEATSIGIPKQTILQESLNLLQALKQKMDRLKESLDDGKQYNQTLQSQLSRNVDSFIRSGVPPTIIKNFLKSVSTAALSVIKSERKNQPPVDMDADLEYPKPDVPIPNRSTMVYEQPRVALPESVDLANVMQAYRIAYCEDSKTPCDTKVVRVGKSETPQYTDTQSTDSAHGTSCDIYIDNPERDASEIYTDANSQETDSLTFAVEDDENDAEVRSTTGDDALLDDLMDPEQWGVNDIDQSDDVLHNVNQTGID